MTITQPDQVKELLAKRAQAQRELRPYLERYEAACQAVVDEVARVDGLPTKSVFAFVSVKSGLDSNLT